MVSQILDGFRGHKLSKHSSTIICIGKKSFSSVHQFPYTLANLLNMFPLLVLRHYCLHDEMMILSQRVVKLSLWIKNLYFIKLQLKLFFTDFLPKVKNLRVQTYWTLLGPHCLEPAKVVFGAHCLRWLKKFISLHHAISCELFHTSKFSRNSSAICILLSAWGVGGRGSCIIRTLTVQRTVLCIRMLQTVKRTKSTYVSVRIMMYQPIFPYCSLTSSYWHFLRQFLHW